MNDVSNFCVNENITRWKNNKKDLLDVLSIKNEWDADRLCVHKRINYAVKGRRCALYLLESRLECNGCQFYFSKSKRC